MNNHVQRPVPLEVQAENIPEYLVARPQWVLWRYVLKNGKWAKVPFRPNGSTASSTNPDTWTTFAAAWEAYRAGEYDGVGFVLNGATDEDGLTVAGVDMDGVIGNPDREARAHKIITTLNSYTEVSPSGAGYRIFVLANPLDRSVNHDGLEFYAGPGRYLTVTGHVLGGALD